MLCNILAALFSVVLVLPFVFMLLDRQLPIKLSHGKIYPYTVESGSPVTVSWTVAKARKFGPGLFDCQGTFIRRIADSGGFTIDTKPQPIMSYKLIGDNVEGTFTKDFIMPMMLPGPATYQVITTYWCNPLQKFLPIVNHEEIVHFMVASGQNR